METRINVTRLLITLCMHVVKPCQFCMSQSCALIKATNMEVPFCKLPATIVNASYVVRILLIVLLCAQANVNLIYTHKALLTHAVPYP